MCYQCIWKAKQRVKLKLADKNNVYNYTMYHTFFVPHINYVVLQARVFVSCKRNYLHVHSFVHGGVCVGLLWVGLVHTVSRVLFELCSI